MMTLTRLGADETTTLVQLRDAKGRTATYKVYRDGSHAFVEGATWLLQSMRKAIGARPAMFALHEAIRDGQAIVAA
jgi:hypothetical protein